MMVMDWRENFIVEPQAIRELVLQTKRIAVLGIKTEAQADQPSVYVPMYLQKAGLEIIPVPVYYHGRDGNSREKGLPEAGGYP